MPISEFISGVAVKIVADVISGTGKALITKWFVPKEEKKNYTGKGQAKEAGQIIQYRKEEGSRSVVLFVHGFSGNPEETFGATPDMLVAEPKFAQWDVFSIGYSTDIFPSIGKGLWSVNPDISMVAGYLNTLLKVMFDKYDRIAFVAHSMGGLAVQRAILDMDAGQLGKVSHLLLFGTPSDGLHKAEGWVKFWSVQTRDLGSSSKFIQKLQTDRKQLFASRLSFTFLTVAGNNDQFVPDWTSLDPFDKKYRARIEGNHLTMVKPKSGQDTNNQSYQIILNLLTTAPGLKGLAAIVNNAAAGYHAIIAQNLKRARQIDLNGLKELAFALEGLGRCDEALQVLLNHPDSLTHGDTLGIIAGRYKRAYLLNSLPDDLANAIEYYQKGLDLAVANNDKWQIQYHAINLAFLNIFAHRNSTAMKSFAQTALSACTLSSKYMWELATIAEAKLYLEDSTGQAEKYYRKAAAIAGNDIRAKDSMYSNAYYGYRSITGSTDDGAGFLKFLEKTFLK